MNMNPNGKSRETSLCFRMDMFYPRSSEGKSGIIAYWARKGGGDLVLFQFDSNTVTRRKLASISLSNPKDRRKLEKYFGWAPHWKSIQNYPVQVMDIASLMKAGYDVGAAMKVAEPRHSPSL